MLLSRTKALCGALALALSVAIAGCGGTGTSGTASVVPEANDVAYDGATEEAAKRADTEGAAGATAQLDAPEKMVYTADLALVSREFDQTSKDLDAVLEAAGAVVFGDNVWQTDWSDYVSRTRELTVRVAADGLRDLVGAVSELDGVQVTSSSIHASDRTKEYNDSEDRIQLLRQEYDFYEKTVQETTDPETRLVYTERMFELLDEIKQLEDTKAGIDQDVAYSVVTITLSEDNSLASHDGSTGLWQDIQDAFVMIPHNVAAAFGYVLLFLITILPAVLIIGVIALVVIALVRRRRARHPRASRDAGASEGTPARPEIGEDPPVPGSQTREDDNDE